MSALTDKIAGVLRAELPTSVDEDAWAAHVASVLEAELQLTEECGYQIDGDPQAEPDAWFPAADLGSIRRVVTHRRWVSAWSPVPEEQP